MHGQSDIEARERYAFIVAFFDVPADKGIAFPFRRRAKK